MMGQTEKIWIIVRDVYGRGHGKDATVQRIMDVIGLNKEAATIAFTSTVNLIKDEERKAVERAS